MPDYYSCSSCHTLIPLLTDEAREQALRGKRRCVCGSTNGRVITSAQLKKGIDAGVYFEIDPIGKRLKKRRS